MSGNLLKEDTGVILCENSNFLGLARKTDYKFCYYSDDGINTKVKVRFYEGTGNYNRTDICNAITETISGSQTYAQLVTRYNSQLINYGTPIAQQT